MRGQVNMANEAKLCSQIHSTFEVLAVQCAIMRYGEDNRTGLSVEQCWMRLCSFQCISSIH